MYLRTKSWIPMLAVLLAFGTAACGDDDGDNNTNNNNNNTVDDCGNGALDDGEECDGTLFGTATCDTEGNFNGGTLLCSGTCTIQTTNCETCGNGVVDAGEDCDGTDLDDTECADLTAFTGGTLACNTATCAFNTAGCTAAPTCSESAMVEDGDLSVSGDGTDWESDLPVHIGSEYFELWIDIYGTYDPSGAASTGMHTLGVGNEATVADCVYCVTLVRYTDSSLGTADKYFFATAGTLNASALGDPTEHYSGILTGLEFAEWDDTTDAAVAGGECYSPAGTYTYDATVVGM